ncbi:MAG: hypothetical protein ACI37R_05535 [Candidatus Avigastranaerophilus sp.]
MTPLLEWGLFSFIIIFSIVLIVIAVYLVKFLQESTLAMTNIKDITETTKKELEPALKSINNILVTVSNVSTATNKQFETVKKILTTLLGASCFVFSKAKSGGFINGLLSGFKLFSKKRR